MVIDHETLIGNLITKEANSLTIITILGKAWKIHNINRIIIKHNKIDMNTKVCTKAIMIEEVEESIITMLDLNMEEVNIIKLIIERMVY